LLVAGLALVVSQACGGGASGSGASTPTAIPLPGGGSGQAPGGGFGAGPFSTLGQPDEDLAALFGMTLDELEEALNADGATLGQVADAAGVSRDDLEASLLDRAEALIDGQGEGNFPGGNADFLTQRLPTIIDGIIDGTGFGGAPDDFPGFSGTPGTPGDFPGFSGTPEAPGGFGRFLGLGGNNEALAEFLGVSTDELADRLAEDSLAEIAGENGVSREDLVEFLVAQAEANIDQAVADGTLTQENADQFLDGIQQTIENFIDGTGFGQGPFGGGTPEEGE
jgi:uncharacterized protein YidB (DUF937 family)